LNDVIELFASCPLCKTFETIWFNGHKLMPTQRFKQEKDGRIYHNCGSEKPCMLFPKSWGESSLERHAEE
jgi:hypothetical protein